jgi:O-antigen/teichoic acid export membrane protein
MGADRSFCVALLLVFTPIDTKRCGRLAGVYLLLILIAMAAESAFHWDADGFWLLVALTSSIFFVMAFVKRVVRGEQRELSSLRHHSGR